MNSKRAFAVLCLGLLCVNATQASWSFVPYVQLEFDASQLFNKRVLIAGAVVGCAATAGYFLYRYFSAMTLPKAKCWCDRADALEVRLACDYQRETSLLVNNALSAAHKDMLRDIIAESGTETPYMNYVRTLQNDLSSLEGLENEFVRGVPRLEAAMLQIASRLHEVDLDEQERTSIEQQVAAYQVTLQKMRQLRDNLRETYVQLAHICACAKQFDGYRQELLLARLDRIETQLALHGMHSHCCYR